MNKKSNQKKILVFLPVILGGLLYILFRSDNLLMFKWFEYINIKKTIFLIRNNINFHPSDWIIYNLPDGLWLFSYTSLMINIWKNKMNYESIFWIFIVPFIAILSEFLQLFNLISGTFDFIDLLFYILGTIIPIILYIRTNNLNIYNYEKKN